MPVSETFVTFPATEPPSVRGGGRRGQCDGGVRRGGRERIARRSPSQCRARDRERHVRGIRIAVRAATTGRSPRLVDVCRRPRGTHLAPGPDGAAPRLLLGDFALRRRGRLRDARRAGRYGLLPRRGAVPRTGHPRTAPCRRALPLRALRV